MQQGIEELRQVWRQALQDDAPNVSAEDVLDRLQRKYKALAKTAVSTAAKTASRETDTPIQSPE